MHDRRSALPHRVGEREGSEHLRDGGRLSLPAFDSEELEVAAVVYAGRCGHLTSDRSAMGGSLD
jgi:hypothetical protein